MWREPAARSLSCADRPMRMRRTAWVPIFRFRIGVLSVGSQVFVLHFIRLLTLQLVSEVGFVSGKHSWTLCPSFWPFLALRFDCQWRFISLSLLARVWHFLHFVSANCSLGLCLVVWAPPHVVGALSALTGWVFCNIWAQPVVTVCLYCNLDC